MATYEITGPDGNKYQVVGPEGATEEDVTKYVQSQMTGATGLRNTTPNTPDLRGQDVDVMGGQRTSMLQGIPFAGGYVSSTPESETFEKLYPKNAALNKVMTGAAATAPLFGYGAPAGGLRSMAVGGALGAGDTAARGGDPGQIAMGGGLGALSSATGRATGGGTANLITPHMATPEHQDLVNTLRQEVPGVRLTAGQSTGSQGLRFKEANRGRAIDVNPDEQLQRDVTGNLMTRIGQQPSLATQPAMDAALRDIGGTFDRVLGRNDLTIDPQSINEVQNIVSNYHSVQDTNAIKSYFGEILGNMQPGKVVSGENYQIVRSQLAKMQRANGSGSADAENADTAGRIKDALDDAFERSIANKGAAGPAGPGQAFESLSDLNALRQARSDYRNYLTLERAATAPGVAQNYGYISPEALQSGVKAMEGTRAYATGRGDLSTLANAYAGVDRRLPFSGTSEYMKDNNTDRNIALIIGGAGSGEAYQKNQDPEKQGDFGYMEPVVGGLGGYGLAKGINAGQAHFLLNPGMQTYLRNQIMNPQMRAILRALGAGAGTSTVPQTQPAAQTIVNTLTGNKPNAP